MALFRQTIKIIRYWSWYSYTVDTNHLIQFISHLMTKWFPKIINDLDPNKAHGHDMLSIRMIKLCGNSICKPLSIIFNDCLSEGKFLSDWKKAHVALVLKKGGKNFIFLFPYFQSAVNVSSVSFIMSFSPFLLIIS